MDKLIGTIGGKHNITVEDIESSRDLKRQLLFNLCPGHVEIAFKIIQNDKSCLVLRMMS